MTKQLSLVEYNALLEYNTSSILLEVLFLTRGDNILL